MKVGPSHTPPSWSV